MFEKNFKSLGIKDMHSMQIEALMEFVGTALHLAALCEDREILDETEELADNLVRLFGGNGVKVVIEADY